MYIRSIQFLWFTYRISRYITNRQNYIGFTYRSPIILLYLFTVHISLAEKRLAILFHKNNPTQDFIRRPFILDCSRLHDLSLKLWGKFLKVWKYVHYLACIIFQWSINCPEGHWQMLQEGNLFQFHVNLSHERFQRGN